MNAEYLTGPGWGILMLVVIVGLAVFFYKKNKKVRSEVDDAVNTVKRDVEGKLKK